MCTGSPQPDAARGAQPLCPQPAVLAGKLNGCSDQLRVARGERAVSQLERVFEPDPNVPATVESELDDTPGRHPVAVVDARGFDVSAIERGADRGRSRLGLTRVGVLRLHQHTDDAWSIGAVDEGLGVGDGPDAGLDADPDPEQKLAELHDVRIGEVHRHEVRSLDPAGDQLQTPARVRLDPGCGTEPERHAWARLTDGLPSRVACLFAQAFATVVSSRMH